MRIIMVVLALLLALFTFLSSFLSAGSLSEDSAPPPAIELEQRID